MKVADVLTILVLLVSCNHSNGTSSDFHLCTNDKHPYYYPPLEYKGGFYEVKEHFFKGYEEIKGKDNTGIIRIKFQVNCKGETGNFEVETYSLSYKKMNLNKNIVEQFVRLTKCLDNWIPAIDDNGGNVDSYKFFAFKIIDGKLQEILPK